MGQATEPVIPAQSPCFPIPTRRVSMRAPLKWLLIAAAAAGCSDSSSPSNGGGPVGSVTVGNNTFTSAHNGKEPAVDTVAVGGTVTWTWTNTGSVPHSVKSDSTPGATFTSSDVLSGNGTTYQFTFTAPGTYDYDCAVHGEMMHGTVVVQ
jgi:plastocyanin